MGSFFSETNLTDDAFFGIKQTKQEMVSLHFTNCTFTNCDFSESIFMGCRFEDCFFRHCNMSNVHIYGSEFMQCKFENSKLLGICWNEKKESLAFSVQFFQTILDYSSFAMLDLRHCSFKDCSMLEVDYSNANLQKIAFSGCNLSRAVFAHTDLTGADLRRASNYTIDLTNNKVSKARFSLPDAVNLLKPFGVSIE
ncbi:MAG: pentapeptide repeat-containing protein [Bacteroidales bacterium]